MCRIARVVVAIVLSSTAAGCGEETPAEPETTVTPANIVASGPWSWERCGSTCEFRGEARNTGMGCAADIRGVTRLYDSQGDQIGGAISWRGAFLPDLVRPNEAFVYRTNTVASSVKDATQTYQSEAFWTNVRC